MAERALRPADAAPSCCTACAGGGTCQDSRPLLKREPGAHAEAPTATTAMPNRSGGRPLEPSLRQSMEERLGHDFSGVRIHTDSAAAAAARGLRARAFTSRSDITFAAGRFDPSTLDGRRLLAHELAHVVQQRCSPLGVQRYVDPTVANLDPSELAQMDDASLAQMAAQLTTALGSVRPGAGEYDGLRENLEAVQAVQVSRVGQVPDEGNMDRPAVLPVDEGYLLQPAVGLPAELVDSIPEGDLVQLPTSWLASASGQPQAEGQRGLWQPPELGVAQFPGEVAMNTPLRQLGFRAAGPNSIGIVGIPRLGTPGMRLPDPAAPLDVWGHTALYVRQGGRITWISGFNPTTEFPGGLINLLRNYRQIESGAGVSPGLTSADAYLFTVPGARALEYPVAPTAAEALIARMPPLGPTVGTGLPEGYTARPAEYARLHPELNEPFCVASNCGLQAVSELERSLGGVVGRAGEGVSITSETGGAPIEGTASQGRLYRFMGEVEAGRAVPTQPVGATGEAVASAMPRIARVLKVGGRVFFVVSLLTVPLEILFAPEGQRGRTAVGALAGLAGGFAAGFATGAVAGLVCGPGAPVCSFLIGLGLGIAGYFAARALAERVYDVSTDFYPTEVADLMRDLQALMTDYQVILGGLELAQRSDASLRGLGTTDVGDLRRRTQETIRDRRAEARTKELAILRAFEEAYARARTSFAGLRELDEMRRDFLALERRVSPAGESAGAEREVRAIRRRAAQAAWSQHPSGSGVPPSYASEVSDRASPPETRSTRDVAEEAFARIDRSLTLSDMTAANIRDMEQWEEIDDALDTLHSAFYHLAPDAVNWEDVTRREQEATLMIRNARYRLDPAAQGETRAPLLDARGRAGRSYGELLAERERRLSGLHHLLLHRLAGGAESPLMNASPAAEEPAGPDRSPGTALALAQEAVTTYRHLIDSAPPIPAALRLPTQVRVASDYRAYVDDHSDLEHHLQRLRTAERVMGRLLAGARSSLAPTGGPEEFRLRAVVSEALQVQNLRRTRGLLYLDEAEDIGQALDAPHRETHTQHALEAFGSPSVAPLSALEAALVQAGDLGAAGEGLTTLRGQIARMSYPPVVAADGRVSRVHRLVGSFEEIPLLITVLTLRSVERSENVLVGDVGRGSTIWTPRGDEATVRVVPLNRAAIRLFGGTGPQTVRRALLEDVRTRDLAP